MSRNRIQDLKQQVERLNALSGVSNRNAEAIEYTLESLQDYLDDLDSSMAQIRDVSPLNPVLTSTFVDDNEINTGAEKCHGYASRS